MSERSRRFRRFRRRTADVATFNNRPAIIRSTGLKPLNETDRIPEETISSGNSGSSSSRICTVNESTESVQLCMASSRTPTCMAESQRRKSIKRDRDDDIISTGNKVSQWLV